MNVAELKYEIDSSQAKTAEKNLGKMSKAAKDAESAQKGLGSTATKAGRQIASANDNTSKAAKRVLADLKFENSLLGLNSAEKAVNINLRKAGVVAASAEGKAIIAATLALESETAALGRRGAVLGGLRTSIVAGAALIGPAIAAAFSVGPLFAFKDALAEVSTLVDTTTFDMKALEAGALAQSAAFGGTAAGQAKAYYAIISAGASSAAQATEILTASNKLAVGGVTDVATASDGLTSVLNAYGAKVEGAAAVSDALFVGMRAGKTTIGELSSSLGKVAPLAAQTGVSFDELVASISALTKGGIATSEAVTGVRAILAAVAKPTKEASDMAASLGLEFNSAALASKGLAAFIQDLVAKTGGSTDALSMLFGGVEALVPAMALAGQAGADFTAILAQMETKAGSTEEAFNKMANSPGFQAGRVWAALQAEILGVSGSMSGPLTAALKAIADNMGAIVTVAAIFTAGHLAAAILPIIANLITLTSTLGAATVAARALSVAMAFVGGPIGAAVIGLAGAYLLLRDNVSSAAAAAQTAESAYLTNVSSLDAAKASSEGFTQALRNQIAMQVEAAKASLAQADAQLAISKGRASGFRETFGFGFQPLDYAADQARIESLALDGAYQRLEQQLAEVDAGLKTVAVSTSTVATAASGAGKALKEAAKTDPWKGLRKAVDTAKEGLDFAKGAAKGFLSDLRQGLMNGEGLWQSFGKAALNVLDKIIGKIEDQLVDALFSAGSAGSGLGGGGGIFGAIFGGLGRLLGFAKGTNYAPGGVAMVGEEGPELVELPRGSRVNTANETRRMMSPANGNGKGSSDVVTVVLQDDSGRMASIADKQIETRSGTIVQVAVQQSKSQILPTVADYQGNRAGSDFRTG